MFNNNLRVGRFTSSRMADIMSSGRAKDSIGKPFTTYVDQKRRERKLGRSLDLNKGSRSTAWGHLMEAWVMYDKLGFTYKHTGKEPSLHPEYNYWAGTTDLLQPKVKVGDIKCYEPDNFTKLADVLNKQDIELFKSEYKKEYWQLISNACIHKVDRVESILFMPLKSELERIREWINETEIDDIHRYRWIMDSDDEELPYIPDDCEEYQSLTTFEFDAPKDDRQALTERLMLAESELNYKPELL